MSKLTDRKCITAPPGKHMDGNGLQLVVYATGARNWIWRYMLRGRRREMGLGAYPAVSLKAARAKAEEYRGLLRAGTDPIGHRASAVEPVPTFTQAAARYIRAHRHGWRNRKHARQWVATLKTYARPVMGSKAVDAIGTEDVLRVLASIWTTKTETAKRVQGRLENVLDWATAMKHRTGENPARWRGHLDKLLPRPTRVNSVVHHPAMPYDELPALMAELERNGSLSAKALELLILTATRTSEVLGAEWSEFDLRAALWTIPAIRMKARREHRVPLSTAAASILERLPRIAGQPFTFPGQRYGRPLSNMALLQLMRGMGFGAGGNRGAYVPHGFRSSFRDWAGEVSSFPRDAAEMALAHVVQNKVEAAYRRGDLFDKRRAMMQAWADWCLRPAGRLRATT